MIHSCEARQYSDQMRCERCNRTWDTNDQDPPSCRSEDDLRRVGMETLARLHKELKNY